MKITTISATNVKGFNFTRHLGPVTVLTGPNNSGKSATLRAVELGLLGYCPKLGKRPSDTFQLSSAGEMEVTLSTERLDVVRSWSMDRKGKITYSGYEGELVPAVMLDAREYFELGATDRMRYVFSHIPVGDRFKQPELVAEIKNATRPEQTNPEIERVMAEVFGELEKPSQQPVQDWLQQLLTSATVNRKAANDNADRMKKSAEASTALGSDELPLNLQSCEKARQLLSSQIADLQSKLATTKEQQAQFERNKTIRLNNEQNARTELTQTEDMEVAVAKIGDDMTALTSHLPTFPAIAAQLQKAQADLSAKGGHYKAYEAQTLELEAEQRKLVHQPCCPTCGAQGKGFNDLVIAKFGPLLKTRREEMTRLMAEGTLAKAIRDDLQTKANEAQAADARIAGLIGETQLSQRNIQERLNKARTGNRQIQSARDAISNLPEATGEDQATAINGMAANLDALRVQHTAADQKVKQAAGQQANEASRLKAIEEFKLAEIKVDLLGRYVKALQESQRMVVDFALNSLLGLINKVTQSIIPYQIICVDGELGILTGGKFVPAGSDLLAGSWDAVLFSSISIALASKSPFKLFVLDEATRLSIENKEKLATTIVALVSEGVLDQSIIVDTSVAGYAGVDGLTFISLT